MTKIHEKFSKNSSPLLIGKKSKFLFYEVKKFIIRAYTKSIHYNDRENLISYLLIYANLSL